MKKSLLSILIVCCSLTAMNAQLYMGAGLGVNHTQNSNDGNKLNSEISFNIMPEIGYSLNDRWDIGITLGFGMNNETTEAIETNGVITTAESTNKLMNWSIAPYARYSFFHFGKFKVLAKAELYIRGNTDKTETVGIPVITTSNEMAYGLNISPLMIYNVNDKISLHAQLNFCSLDIGFVSEKESKNSTFNAGLGIDSNNLLNTGLLTIGFTYSF